MKTLWTIGLCAGGAMALGLAAAPALRGAGFCLPLICGFTETGKKGGARYIDAKVTPQKLAELDAQIATGLASGMLKAAGSTQRPEFKGYGMDLPKVEAELQAMLRNLQGHWAHRQPPPVIVKIVGSLTRVPSVHPDGVILVPLGMLTNATSDDQIAWLLAHEYSHMALGHFAREAKRKSTQKQMSALASLVPLGVELAQQDVTLVNGRPTFTKVEDPAVQRTGEMLQYRNNDLRLIFALVNSFFSRKQEDQADVAGLDLLIAAKYDNGGSTTAIQMIAKDEQHVEDFLTSFSRDVAAFSGKQAAATGAQMLQDAQSGNKSGKDPLGGLLSSLGRNAGRIALNKLNDTYSRSHRPPDKRAEGIAKYYSNVHAGKTPLVDGSDNVLKRIRLLPEFAEAKLALEATLEAREILRLKGSQAQAEALIVKAQKTRYADTPVVANAIAFYYDQTERYALAETWYDIASDMRPPPPPPPAPRTTKTTKKKKGKTVAAPAPAPAPVPVTATVSAIYAQSVEGYDRHIAFLLARGKYPRALQVITLATSRLSDDDAFLPSLILLHGRMKQIDKMVAVLQRCVVLEDPVIAGKCKQAFFEAMYKPGALEALTPVERATVEREYQKIETNARSGDIWQKLADSVRTNDDDDDDPKSKKGG